MALRLQTTNVFERIDIGWGRFPIIVLQGSTRSSKTYSVLQTIILRCLNSSNPLEVIIGTKVFNWGWSNIFPDFQRILTGMGMWSEKALNRGSHVYTLNGSKISFIGFDSARGEVKAHGKASDICFLNEANYLDYEIYSQLNQRCRQQMILDFNPNFGKEHWIPKKVLPQSGALFIKSTFRDNPFLEDKLIKTIEGYEPTPLNIATGTADATHWKMYGLGEMAVIKGLIFPNVKSVPSFPKDATNVCYGMDFGFSNDPSTLIKKGEYEGELYFQEIFYKTGLTSIINPKNPEQPSIEREFEIHNVPLTRKIWADSENPAYIKDLQNCGYNVSGCEKGKGSILAGINTMKRYKINIVESSYNLWKEFQNYKWVENRGGEPTTTPVDTYNHGIDSCRYSVFMSVSDSDRKSLKVDSIRMNTGIGQFDAF